MLHPDILLTENFHNLHEGETCLIIGNGPSLNDIPNHFLNQYTTFGSNLINRRKGFTPTYYSTVDSRVMREFRGEIMAKLFHIPKFLPSPNLDQWTGPNIYRFRHRPGPLWPHALAGELWPRELLHDKGITYTTVTHVLMQLAYYMGFNTMLFVGLDNTPRRGQHFYSGDEWKGQPDMDVWDRGYGALRHGMIMSRPTIKMWNLSTYSEVTTIPKGDWRDW